MKKILSLVLVIALVLGSFSFAFAATPADVVGEDYEEAVEVLMALGVVNGYPDGTYKPERVVTRAEMAKLLVEALGYGQLAGGTAPYSDTAGHWAAGSIGLASGIGLVQGYPDGTFKPDATVSFDEAVTMILRALGYTDESLRGAWPTNYKIKAIDLGLYDDTSAQTGGADRGNVAIMLFNALGQSLVEVKEGVAQAVSPAKSLIDKVGNKVDMRDDNEYFTYDDIYHEDDALDTVIDLAPYLYHQVTYYTNKDGDIAYVAKVHTKTLTGTVVNTYANDIKVEDANGDEYIVKTSTSEMTYNGVEGSKEATSLTTSGAATVKVIYSGTLSKTATNTAIKGVVAEEFWIWQATADAYSAARRPLVLARDQVKLPAMLDADDEEVLDTANLTIEGDVTTLAQIAKDDLVHVFASDVEGEVSGYPEKVKLVVIRDTLEGRFTRRIDADTVVIGGVTLDESVVAVTDLETLVLGDTYKLLLDKDGDIYRATKTDSTSSENYALYIAAVDGEIEDIAGVRSIKTAPKVRLFTEGGDAVVYNLKTSGFASGLTSGSAITLGSLTVTIVDKDIVVTVSGSAFGYGDLVEYKLNSSGQVDSVLAPVPAPMSSAAYTYDSDDMTLTAAGSVYDLSSSTLIFDKTSNTWNDWDVVSTSFLGKTVTASAIVDDFDVEVLVVTATTATTDKTYAAVTKVQAVYDANQDAAVTEITAFVDGVATVYLTDEDETVTVVKNKLYDLELSEGLVIAATEVDFMADDAEVTAISGMRLRFNTTVKTVADDAAVYIYQDGEFSLGTFSDILVDDYVALYNLNSDSEYTVVILNLDATK